MVAVDTNVLVRLLTADDPGQYRASRQLFATAEVFIPDTVVLEAEWVLRAAYSLAPAAVCHALRRVFGLPNVHLADARRVAQALAWHESGLDFADAFHLVLSQGQTSFRTFDGALVTRAKGLGDCPVSRP
ncbi:MAG: type II toxin-antitoxin system VapC family toxin [Chromatiales bacterium]|nr:type II toxin-antitoxin system VapC family toxin [Chromatiales bacterium]